MRLKALQELGRTEASCLVTNDADPFTYNDEVNRLSLIQEHTMVLRAIKLSSSGKAPFRLGEDSLTLLDVS